MNRIKQYLAGPVFAVAIVSGVALSVADSGPSATQSDTSTVSADGVSAQNIIW